MTEWREYKLGEFIKVKHGFAFKGDYIVPDETDKILVTPGNFHIGGGFKSDKFKYFNCEDFPQDYILKSGDIVVTMTDLSKDSDTLGYSAIIPFSKNKKYLHNQRIGLVQFISNKVCPDFVYWLLRTKEYQSYIVGSASGTSIMHTSPSRIENYSCLFPPLNEQRRIAAILSSLDDKIDLLHRENATLEQMAETLFRQWFVVEAKEEWEEGKLGDIVDVKSGFAFKSSSFVDFGLYRLITIKAVQDGYLTLENADYISETPDNIKDYCLLKEGDILLSLTGNVGRCCLVDRERLLLNQRVALLCAKDNKNWAFVYTLFRMQSMKSKLEEMAKGTAQPNLSPIELSNMQFDIPPTKLLDGFSDAATPLLRKALSNNKQIQTLIQTRDGLLPRLMGGEVKI